MATTEEPPAVSGERRTRSSRGCASAAPRSRASRSSSARRATWRIASFFRRCTRSPTGASCRTGSRSSASPAPSRRRSSGAPTSRRRSASTRATRSKRRLGLALLADGVHARWSSPTTRPRTRWRSSSRSFDEERGTAGNRLYYLAVPPSAIGTIAGELGKRRSTTGWTRIIVEKPFGHDLASAKQLNAEISEHFAENEVFRIDHYLGKETVQNMLALRFANGIFEPIWNRQFIDHVQITVAESIGIEGRAAFYEQAGAIRDIFQNHLLQLARADGDGAAGRLQRRLGAQREGEGAARDPHAGPEAHRPRPVRARLRRRQGGARLPRGGGRRRGLAHRDVLRGQALRRQLALGRHAVLRARRQAAGAARDDDRDPVQARAAPALRGLGRRGAAAERAAGPHPAGRGRVARGRREGARTGHVDPDGAHGLPLRRRLPHRAPRGVRAADPRTRSSATRRSSRAPTRWRSSGRSSTRSWPPGSATSLRSRTTRPARGGRPRPTTCSPGTAGRGAGTRRDAGRPRDVDGRGHRDRRGRAPAGPAPRRERRHLHAHLGDDASRLGAGGVARQGARHAPPAGGAPPVADDPHHAARGRRDADRRRHLAHLLQAPRDASVTSAPR